MGLPGRLHPKPHGSGCDQESALGLEQPLVAVGSVAVVDVVGHRLLDGHPVGVVGVVDDELVDRPEVTLDPIQEAGVGRGEDQFDVVLLGPGPDVGGLVGGEVVGDQVDPDLRLLAHPDLAVERQDLVAALVRAHAAVQAVGVHVVGAEPVAHPAVLAVGRAQPLRSFALGPAGSLVGCGIRPASQKRAEPPAGRPVPFRRSSIGRGLRRAETASGSAEQKSLRSWRACGPALR